MANGYMGKLLNVDLTRGTFAEEALDPALCRDYIGGYGLGARLLYDRIPAGADPLGPQNILGFLTGPLTGTPAIIGSRFTVVGKSPEDRRRLGGRQLRRPLRPAPQVRRLRRPALRRHLPEAGLPVRRRGHRPSCGTPADLWGMGVSALEDLLEERHGKGIQVCSIGPAGERLALTACIMNDKERAAGRSGLGAVMGSKRLKCVVVKGKLKVPVHDGEKMKDAAARLPQAGHRRLRGLQPLRHGRHHARRRSERRRTGQELGRGGHGRLPLASGRGASATTPSSAWRATSPTAAGTARSPAAAR